MDYFYGLQIVKNYLLYFYSSRTKLEKDSLMTKLMVELDSESTSLSKRFGFSYDLFVLYVQNFQFSCQMINTGSNLF